MLYRITVQNIILPFSTFVPSFPTPQYMVDPAFTLLPTLPIKTFHHTVSQHFLQEYRTISCKYQSKAFLKVCKISFTYCSSLPQTDVNLVSYLANQQSKIPLCYAAHKTLSRAWGFGLHKYVLFSGKRYIFTLDLNVTQYNIILILFVIHGPRNQLKLRPKYEIATKPR